MMEGDRMATMLPVQLPTILYDLPRNPAIAVGLPLTVGWLTGLITRTSVRAWYPSLRKPSLQPPRWAFPVAWTLLYASMGAASHLLVAAYDSSLPGSAARSAADHALKLYWLQYGLNILWSPTFFGLRQITIANVDIILLLATLLKLAPAAFKVDQRTLFAFGPYVAWVSFATYLNSSIWWLNLGPGSKQLRK
ncbi:BQ5605_C014g07466 [Microbotryum silenes-dioicae]|uniref:BQ5605_C014g07466 protein n=1 Tax=Microbotryum silenes-dioicae TaxID=796604 RepID=A0A2X0NRC0_9BASI|nr:BQ5605_C014g07466 [Microbotryum silenes-dioicae]